MTDIIGLVLEVRILDRDMGLQTTVRGALQILQKQFAGFFRQHIDQFVLDQMAGRYRQRRLGGQRCVDRLIAFAKGVEPLFARGLGVQTGNGQALLLPLDVIFKGLYDYGDMVLRLFRLAVDRFLNF